MRRANLVKLLLVMSLLIGLAWTVAGGNYSVKQIMGKDTVGKYIVEDMFMCANGQTMWMVGVANNDNARLFKLDLATDTLAGDPIDVGVLYGPRGGRGLAINYSCTLAYVINYPINTVSVIDLETGEQIAEIPVPAKPTGVALSYPDGWKLFVASSFSNIVTVIDTPSNTDIGKVEVGTGANNVFFVGRVWRGTGWIGAVSSYDDTITITNVSQERYVTFKLPTSPTRFDRGPFEAVATQDGSKIYISNFVGDSVTIIDTRNMKIDSIPVGDSPRYLAITTDDKYVFVANVIDKTVSVISTATDSVVDTIEFIEPNEPAPIGAIAVTKDNRYLYVFWTGGRSGTPADFVIFKIDLSPLYG